MARALGASLRAYDEEREWLELTGGSDSLLPGPLHGAIEGTFRELQRDGQTAGRTEGAQDHIVAIFRLAVAA